MQNPFKGLMKNEKKEAELICLMINVFIDNLSEV